LAPPKCIHCGSTDIVVLPVNQAVAHPEGRGMIEVTCAGMWCSTRFNEWFLTPEGERIPRDTRPTYWRHAALGDDAAPGRPRHRR